MASGECPKHLPALGHFKKDNRMQIAINFLIGYSLFMTIVCMVLIVKYCIICEVRAQDILNIKNEHLRDAKEDKVKFSHMVAQKVLANLDKPVEGVE